ncbi:hypothetical protein BIU88_09700 [Chlorobaculum limnaeum]|uniref:Uncharacterized protein n=1 Tax=Chlorobaculum limnaeum TaxID=274537 RepID=A0A1D8D980_CHLLM|nr:hypothetical protein [Chlorobaculum limnaeum]AOS84379.1 hypothetical protein BIU88_09700 [Chlorobaculum limnaeum]
MTLLAIKTEYMHRKVQYEFFSVLQNDIEALRIKLYGELNAYPAQLSDVYHLYYENRIKRANGNPMLGEYAVYGLGDLMSIDKNTIYHFAYPWALMYSHCLLMDDLIDEKYESIKTELLLSHMLFEKALIEYEKNHRNKNDLLKFYHRYRDESIRAMLVEIDSESTYEGLIKKQDVIIQAQKSSMVKFCAEMMIINSKKRKMTKRENGAIESLLVGVQLLDDITDFIEDHKMGRKNILLISTYQWLQKNVFKNMHYLYKNEIDEKTLLIALFFSGALTKSLIVASEYFIKSMSSFDSKYGLINEYITNIALRCRESGEKIERILYDKIGDIGDYQNVLLCGKYYDLLEVYDELVGIVNVLPKCSN